MRFLYAALCVCLLAGSSIADPVEWPVSEGGNGHYYDVVVIDEVSMTWLGAYDDSRGLSHAGFSGHLATLVTAAENQWFLDNFMIPSGLSNCVLYLGGWNDGFVDAGVGNFFPPGIWHWITGEAWSFAGWAASEPSVVNPEGDWLEFALSMFFLYSNGYTGWNNLQFQYGAPNGIPDGRTRGYVVEFDGLPISDLPPLENPVAVDSKSWGSVKSLFR